LTLFTLHRIFIITTLSDPKKGIPFAGQDAKKAESLLRQCIILADSIHLLNVIQGGHQDLPELLTASGRYREALEHFREAEKAGDSMFSADQGGSSQRCR